MQPTSRRAGRFESLRKVYVEGQDRPVEVLEAWEHRGAIVLLLQGVETREQAEALVGCEVLVDSADAMKLGPDEYFVHDLVGLDVVTDTGRELGRLAEVLEAPANDVYVVRGPRGELMVPAVGSVVLGVDLQARRMLIHDLPGLIDPELPV